MRLLLPLLLLLLRGAGGFDMSGMDIKASATTGAPKTGAKDNRVWRDLETENPRAKPSDLEQVCPDMLALCQKDPECAKGLAQSFSGRPMGPIKGLLAKSIECFRENENKASRAEKSQRNYFNHKKVVDDIKCAFCEFLAEDLYKAAAQDAATATKFKGGERASRELLESLCDMQGGPEQLELYLGAFDIRENNPGVKSLHRDVPWNPPADDGTVAEDTTGILYLDYPDEFHDMCLEKVRTQNRQWQLHAFSMMCRFQLRESEDEITEAVGKQVTDQMPRLKELRQSDKAELKEALAGLAHETVEEGSMVVKACATMCDIPLDEIEDDEDEDEDEEEDDPPPKKRKKKKSKKSKKTKKDL